MDLGRFLEGKIGYFWHDFWPWLAFYAVLLLLLILLSRRFFVWKPKQYRAVKVVLGNLVVFVFILLHIIMGLEFYYRYIFDETDNIFQMKTTQRWFDRHVVYNAFTFRDEHFPGDKDPEELRLAIIGDSFVFGYGIKNSAERLNEQLEAKIKKACGKSRVHAIAQPGMDTVHELAFLKQYVARKPYDGVILGYFLNDQAGDDTATNLPWYGQINGWRTRPMVGFLMKNSFALEYFLVHLSLQFDPQVLKGADYYGALYRNEEVWRNHTKTLDTFIKTTRPYRLPLMVVLFPVMNTIGDQYPYRDVHAKLASYFSQNNIPVVDLEPSYSALGREAVMVSKRDFHPNERGHAIAADLVYEKLKETNLVQCPKTKTLPRRPLL